MKVQEIRVVAGVFYKGNKVLLFERTHQNSASPVWEFPGGKVEAGESDQEALVRELDEELGIPVTIGRLIGNSLRQVPGGRWIDLWLYFVQGDVEKIKLQEHTAMKWLSKGQIILSEISWVEQPLVKKVFNIIEAKEV